MLNWFFNIFVYYVNEELKKKKGDDNFFYNYYLSKMNYLVLDVWVYEFVLLGLVEINVVI